ncbi:MAG TPA: 4-(cytidine 5'-diphospho)-2-C-methyl-D-erythritol kinase [bacterium]|nr:4-(cytidine 5'-diphospho)-2-C-methyl-D-erythritol kinase [bacterium]
MHSLTLASPAKLNLFLRVVGRYPDGYHKIVTLFHRISLADTLRLKKRAHGFSLTCSDRRLPTDERNIVTRAYRLLRKEIPDMGGVSVQLTKRIPAGGGLGGGSSNAAHFLLGITQLYRLSLDPRRLERMGKALGADVPFFLSNVNQAMGKGRGDEITPLSAERRKWFVLVTFKEALSTREVYTALPKRLAPVSLTKVSHAANITYDFLNRPFRFGRKKVFHNDLEFVACRLRPEIRKVIVRMKQLGASWVGMSGSGPTVFAILSHQLEAQRLCEKWRFFLPSEQVISCHSF